MSCSIASMCLYSSTEICRAAGRSGNGHRPNIARSGGINVQCRHYTPRPLRNGLPLTLSSVGSVLPPCLAGRPGNHGIVIVLCCRGCTQNTWLFRAQCAPGIRLRGVHLRHELGLRIAPVSSTQSWLHTASGSLLVSECHFFAFALLFSSTIFVRQAT